MGILILQLKLEAIDIGELKLVSLGELELINLGDWSLLFLGEGFSISRHFSGGIR